MLRRFNVVDASVLTCLTGCMFSATFWFQARYLTVFDYMPRASLFFLPAGIRIISFIAARGWGLLGISAGTLVTLTFDTSWQPAHWHDYISAFEFFCLLPYLGTIGIQKLLAIDRDLTKLTVAQVIKIAFLGSLINGLSINTYLYIEGVHALNDLNTGILAASFGDVTGIAFTLFLVSIYPQLKSSLSKLTS